MRFSLTFRRPMLVLAAAVTGAVVTTGRIAPAPLTAQRTVAGNARSNTGGTVPQGTTALVGGTLIDGNGGAPITNSVILIRGTTIVAVGRVGSLAVPAGATVISTEGMHLLPGLWDMHVHLMLVGHGNYAHWDSVYPGEWGRSIMPAAARQSLMAGVTSVRDLGAPLEEVLDVKRRIARGELQGSAIYTSGPFLQHAPYPGTEKFRWGIAGVADARAKVKRLADAGVDVIKLIDQDQMTTDEIRAIVDEAHAHKLPVVAHAHRPEEIRRGLAIGVDDFEHTGLQTAPAYPVPGCERPGPARGVGEYSAQCLDRRHRAIRLRQEYLGRLAVGATAAGSRSDHDRRREHPRARGGMAAAHRLCAAVHSLHGRLHRRKHCVRRGRHGRRGPLDEGRPAR